MLLYFFLMITRLKLAISNNWKNSQKIQKQYAQQTGEDCLEQRGATTCGGRKWGKVALVKQFGCSCEWFAQKRFTVISFSNFLQKGWTGSSSKCFNTVLDQWSLLQPFNYMSTMFLLLTLSSLVFQFFPRRGITPLWGWKVTLDRACSTLPDATANRAGSPSFGKREGTSCPGFSPQKGTNHGFAKHNGRQRLRLMWKLERGLETSGVLIRDIFHQNKVDVCWFEAFWRCSQTFSNLDVSGDFDDC